MADDLFDTRDIFETAEKHFDSSRSQSQSPLNENIDSYDQMQRVISEFDEDSSMRFKKFKQINSLLNQSEVFLPLSEITELKKHWSQNNQQNSVKNEQIRQSRKDDNCKISSLALLPESSHESISQCKLEKQSEILLLDQKENIQTLHNCSVKANTSCRQTFISSENHNSKENISIQKQTNERLILEQSENIETLNNIISSTIQTSKVQENDLPNKSDEISQKSQLNFINAESNSATQFDSTPKNDTLITSMPEQHNEIKKPESENQEEAKQPDAWELRLNEFYNRLFSQASIALFIPDQPSMLGKTSIRKPQSLHRLSVKQSVSKPNLQPNIIKRPGTVTKFNVPSMMTRNTKPVSVGTTEGSVQNLNMKSFSVAKFNTRPPTTPAGFGSGILKNSKAIKKENIISKGIQNKQDNNKISRSQSNQISHQNQKDNKTAFFNK